MKRSKPMTRERITWDAVRDELINDFCMVHCKEEAEDYQCPDHDCPVWKVLSPPKLELIDEMTREQIAEQPFTDDEVAEIESLATIGLSNDDPYAEQEYENRLRSLQGWVVRRRIVKAQLDADRKAHSLTLTEVEKDHIKTALEKTYGESWCICCKAIAEKLGLEGVKDE